MKKIYTKLLLGVLFVLGAVGTNAQVNVTNPGNTTPAMAASYGSLAAALVDVNNRTAISGPVIITLTVGQTAPAGGYSLTNVAITGGSNTNRFIFDGGGFTVTAPTPQTSGNLNDGIFKIIGADFITIQNFTMRENAANTTTAAGTNNMTEWGVALLYATSTNGAQNITIQNNSIILDRTYQNTFGIYSNSTHTATAVTTSASATTTAGSNSSMLVYNNNINNVNLGIVVVGPTAAADANTGVDIGGSSVSTANTITNFGTTGTFSGYANVSGTVNGILVRNSNGYNVSYNTVSSSVGGVTAGTLNGIQQQASSATPTGTFTNTINNNNISLQSGLIAGAINGITAPSGSASATSTLNINNNNFNTFGHTVAGTGAITFISTASTHQFTTVNNNTFTNISVNTTGNVTFISHSFSIPATGSCSVNNNSIVTGFTKTGAGGTVTCTTTGGSSGNTALFNQTGNNFSNINVTGATAITGFNNTDGFGTAPIKTITGNTLNSWTGGTSAILCMNYTYIGGTTTAISTNTITNITGQGVITGISIGSSFSGTGTLNIASNTLTNLTSTGTGGSVTGITTSNTSTTINVNNNTINTLSSTGSASTITGVVITGATTHNIFKNKIYDLSGNQTGSIVNGLNLTSGTALNVYNNLIGDLRATAATGLNAINGINASASATYNVYYNSVFLNATSSSVTTFGTSCVTFSSTATTFNSRNNLLYNSSTPAQDGLNTAANGISAVLRRSGGTAATVPANYATTSNNNGYWVNPTAGTNNHLTYVEGTSTITNPQNTVANMRAFMGTRDQASVQENVAFQSTTGSSANFLKYDVAIASQIESGGAGIGTSPFPAPYNDDYSGTIRFGSTGYVTCTPASNAPDIGAWELCGIAADLTGPTISYTVFANTSCLTDRTLTPVTISDASGVNITAGTRPRLYYKKSTNADTYVDNTSATNGWKYVEATGAGGSPFSFTTNFSLLFGAAPATGDNIQYFVVAQDNAGTPNVSINAGTFAATPSGVALTATAFPIGGTPASYTLTPAGLSGTVNVGAGETFKSLTELGAATGLFANINANGLSGNTTVLLMDASITETGATALNVIASSGCSGGPYTLTIKPNTATTTTLTGSLASGALIRLNGADNVTIDGSNSGGSSRDLTITNTNTTAPTAVSLISLGAGAGATNNTIKNCNISTGLQTSTGYGISVGGATPGTTGADNDNVTIQNNSITACVVGIYAQGTAIVSAGGNDNLNITGNTVTYNSNLSSNVGISVNNSLTSTINQNNVTIATTATTGTSIAMQLAGTTGATVNQNTVSVTTAASSAPVGISLETNFVSSTVGRNLITNAVSTNTGGYAGRGITIGTGTASSALTVANNVIYGVNGSNWSAFDNSTSIGIAIGIIGSSTTITTTTGGVNLYFNSVSLAGSMGSGSTAALTSALYVGSGASALDIRNNIFSNTQTGTSATQKNYAIYSAAANTAFTTINYNDYYVSNSFNAPSAIPGNIAATDRTDLSAIQAGFGQNLNSAIANPLFTSPANNLTINAGLTPTVLESGAVAGTGITIDYTGATRPVAGVNGGGTAPDMGAYEFDGVPLTPCTTPTAQPTALILNATGQTTVSGSYTAASPAPTNYLVVRTTASSLAANPVNTTVYAVGANAYFGAGGYVESNGAGLTISSTGLLAGTTYYYWIFSFNTGSCVGGPVYYTAVAPLSGSVTTNVLFTSITSGNWEDGTTWNQSGNIPTAVSDVLIAATHTVTVNSNASVGANVTVSSTGALSVTGSTLSIGGSSGAGIINGGTVTIGGGILNLGPTGGSNRTFNNNGNLSVTSGTLNVNGNLLNASGSTFIQSAGDINIDGNDGTSGGSVAIGNDLFAFGTNLTNYSTGTVTVTGGNLTIVDPHFAGTASTGGAALAFRGASGAGRSFGTAHTTTFGGASGTNAGTATFEFFVDCYVNSSQLVLGNVVVNGGSATRRVQTNAISGGGGLNTGGNLTINAGSELLDLNIAVQGVNVSGNLVNNGTFTTTGLRLALLSGTSFTTISPNTVAQTIGGSGIYRNSAASPTANFIILTSNNTNASGVTFAPGFTPSLSGALNVTAGKVTVDGLSFNGTTTQTAALTAATSIVNVGNVTLNNSVTLSGSGMMNVAGVLSFGNVNTKTLTTAGLLTLKSGATATARVADITNAGANTGNVITGNVTVERYINSDVVGRKWHLLSGISTQSAQTVRQSWQENGGAVNNLGTWITSGTSPLSGYDATSVGSASILRHDSLTATWVTPAATDAGYINDRPGYMVFVRGDRNALPSNGLTAPTVMRTTGALRQGPQTGVTILGTNPGYTLLGNPYASPIAFEAISGTANLSQFFYVWDASYAGSYGVGGFRLVERTGVNTYTATPTTGSDNTLGFIHSGQAFFVKTTGVTNASVVFNENSKASSLSVVNPIVAGVGDQQIYTSLMVMNGNTENLADAVRVKFNDGYKAATTDDAPKMGNFSENISSYRNNQKLIVELRPMITSKDTIFLFTSNLGVKNYRFKISSIDFTQSNVNAWLQDAYTGTNTPLDLTGNNLNVDFSVTSDAASASNSRFRIVFEAKAIQPQTITIKATQQSAAVAVEWKAGNQNDMKQYELEKSTDGINYKKVNTQAATGINGADVIYNWLDVNPVLGDNYYRVRSIAIGGEVKVSQAVVVTIGKGYPAITVYPNPVINHTVAVNFSDMEKGVYQLRMFSTSGQLVFTKLVNHTGGNATQTLVFDRGIAKGTYRLEIVKPNNTKTTKAIIITE